jgi:hypothetical protein
MTHSCETRANCMFSVFSIIFKVIEYNSIKQACGPCADCMQECIMFHIIVSCFIYLFHIFVSCLICLYHVPYIFVSYVMLS